MRKYLIALYIRLSLEDSKTESMSIPNQRLILREKAMSLPEWENAEVVEGVLENVGEDNGIISIHVDSGIKQIDVATIKSARTVYLWESQTGTKRKF